MAGQALLLVMCVITMPAELPEHSVQPAVLMSAIRDQVFAM